MLLKNWGFWSIIANIVLAFTIVIMAVVWSNHECPKVDYSAKETEYTQKIDSLQIKLINYERQILIEKININNLTNDQLDSLWSTIQR